METLVYEISMPMPPETAERIKDDDSKNKTWRQCGKCQDMIELPRGCNIHVYCRCGYSFCYICGAEWKVGAECPHLIKDIARPYFGFSLIILVSIILMIIL